MNGFIRTEAFFDGLFGVVGNILLAFIRRMAPFAVPLAPAFFLAHAVASNASQLMAGAWGTAVGIVAALGLESAGILGAHLTVRLYGRNDVKWQLAAAATAAYLLIGITTIWFLDSTTTDAKAVGTAMFSIAGIVYLLIGLEEGERVQVTAVAHAVDRQEQVEDEQRRHQHERDMAQLQHEQQMERDRLAAQERIKLAEIEAAAQASTVPASSGNGASRALLTCQHCGAQAGKNGQPFRSVQALNAHMAHCPARERAS